MGSLRFLKAILWTATCLSLVAMDLPVLADPPQVAAQSKQPVPVVLSDVELGRGGELNGLAVNSRGVPLRGVGVRIVQQKVVAQAKTDQEGKFRVQGLRGGAYQVVAGKGTSAVRLWAAETAPPAAAKSVLVVSKSKVIAAQSTLPLKYWLADPYVVTGVAAVAVAVPVAVAANRDSGS